MYRIQFLFIKNDKIKGWIIQSMVLPTFYWASCLRTTFLKHIYHANSVFFFIKSLPSSSLITDFVCLFFVAPFFAVTACDFFILNFCAKSKFRPALLRHSWFVSYCAIFLRKIWFVHFQHSGFRSRVSRVIPRFMKYRTASKSPRNSERDGERKREKKNENTGTAMLQLVENKYKGMSDEFINNVYIYISYSIRTSVRTQVSEEIRTIHCTIYLLIPCFRPKELGF